MVNKIYRGVNVLSTSDHEKGGVYSAVCLCVDMYYSSLASSLCRRVEATL
jgi:hypothetical protein